MPSRLARRKALGIASFPEVSNSRVVDESKVAFSKSERRPGRRKWPDNKTIPSSRRKKAHYITINESSRGRTSSPKRVHRRRRAPGFLFAFTVGGATARRHGIFRARRCDLRGDSLLKCTPGLERSRRNAHTRRDAISVDSSVAMGHTRRAV